MPENPENCNDVDGTGSTFFLLSCDAEVVRNSLDTVIKQIITGKTHCR